MSIKINQKPLLLITLALILASIACNLFPRQVTPGSFEEEIAQGNVRFAGNGNIHYGEYCQDPQVAVDIVINAPVKEIDGQEFEVPVNPVGVSATTEGYLIPYDGDCVEAGQGDKHNWPASGLYYAGEAEILFFGCSLAKSSGKAILYGEGDDLYFEGEYACYHENGSLAYEVAFTALPVGK